METFNDKLKRNIQMVTQIFDEKCKQCPKYELCKNLRELALQKQAEMLSGENKSL